MGVALGRPDGEARERRDLAEPELERVLQRHHGRLRARQLGEAAAELATRLGAGERGNRVTVTGRAQVGRERLRPAQRAGLRVVLARVDDEPMQPGGECRLAAELPDPDDELRERLLRGVARVLRVAKQVERQLLDRSRRVAFTERRESSGGRPPWRASRGRGRTAVRRRAAHRESLSVGGHRGLDGPAGGGVARRPYSSAHGPRARTRPPTPPGELRPRLPPRVRDADDAGDGAGGGRARHRGRGRAPDRGPRPAGTELGRRARRRACAVGRPSPAAAGRSVARADASRRRGGRGRNRWRRDDQGPERRAPRRPQGRGRPGRSRRTHRARDRSQHRPGPMARRGITSSATGSSSWSRSSNASKTATAAGSRNPRAALPQATGETPG